MQRFVSSIFVWPLISVSMLSLGHLHNCFIDECWSTDLGYPVDVYLNFVATCSKIVLHVI